MGNTQTDHLRPSPLLERQISQAGIRGPRRPHRRPNPRGRPENPFWGGVDSATPIDTLDLIVSQSGDRSGTANGKLSLVEAWEIAMTWREPLRNNVRLVTECQGTKSSIIDSIAWVRFNACLDDHAQVSVARAAAITWTKLASCPGYGGHENPVFWKCVFSEYATLPDKRESGVVHSVDDSLGFFDQDGHVFPRFMLGGDGLAGGESGIAGLKLFCGAEGEDMAPDIELKLCGLLRWLDPIVAQDRISRHADVCVRLVSSDSLDALRAALSTIGEDLSSRGLDVVSLEQPTCRFRVVQLNLEHFIKLQSDADVDRLQALMRDTTVTIGHLHTYVPDDAVISASAMAEMVSCVLDLEGSSTKAKATSIKLHSHNRPQVFLSALPFATSVHSIDFQALNSNDHELAWVAYALFHPDTPTSSWKDLTLDLSTLSERSAGVIEAMARGNNLEAILYGKKPTGTGYYSAQLKPHAAVRTKPDDSAECLVESTNVGSRVDVCSTPSPSRSTWERWVGAKWVCVVVPAYGLGWVRSDELVDVEVRPPSRSSLTAFEVRKLGLSSRLVGYELLFACISCFGSSLHYLDIGGYTVNESTSMLRTILEQCPNLEVFAANHDGKLWSESIWAHDGSLPCIRQLKLRFFGYNTKFISPSLEHLQSSLSKLTALNVTAGTSSQFRASQFAMAQYLRYATNLHYFYWRDVFGHSRANLPRPYQQTSAWSSQLMRSIPCEDDSHLFVYDKSRVRCVAAFLSVGDFANPTTTTNPAQEGVMPLLRLAQLDRGVFCHIFQFIPNRTKRAITVDL